MSGKFLARLLAVTFALSLGACGGGGSDDDDGSLGGPPGNGNDSAKDESDQDTPEDEAGDTLPEDGIQPELALLGTGEGDGFSEGQLFDSQPSIEFNGDHSFELTIADPDTKMPWLASGQQVRYVSRCLDADLSALDGSAAFSAEGGILTVNYKANGCYGEDRIHAFFQDSNQPAATGTITIDAPPNLDLALTAYDLKNNNAGAVNTIRTTSESLPKNGQARLTVGIVDLNTASELQAGTDFTVEFQSLCADGEQNKSTFEPTSVTTPTGIAETIFTAGDCAVNPQVIKATLDGEEISEAAVQINVDTDVAFQLDAALPEPMSIAPAEFSSEERPTSATITYTLLNQNGDPIPFEDIWFTIDSAGTAEFYDAKSGNWANTISAPTVSDGTASVRVRAKTEKDHEEFRVIASYSYGNDEDQLRTYSKPVVINSMLPLQKNFSLTSGNYAPDTQDENGVVSSLTLFVADKNGNRIRGNTYVNFATDEGSIDPDCTVTDGHCTVTWESLNTSKSHATITASTHGRISDTEIGTIESTIRLLMSTNNNVSVTLNREGDLKESGTRYCATASVELPGQAGSYSPPVGTTITFDIITGELGSGASDSKTISSSSALVGAEEVKFCTTVKPEVEVNEESGEETRTIELAVTVQTPGEGGESDTALWPRDEW